MEEPEIVIDARGHRCPVPTLKLRRALERAPEGARLTLLADDPLARIDVPHFLGQVGSELAAVGEEAGAMRFVVIKRPRSPGWE
ncbi:MAG TPA: sulfurtransferase TusA family protein [Caulobacteraceae bacterium]|nr:sulfurtransferase TusA family protein [Caulobacteraceae bacterium]